MDEELQFSLQAVLSAVVNVYLAHLTRTLGDWHPRVDGDRKKYLNPRACYLTGTCKEYCKRELFTSTAKWLDRELGIKLAELTFSDTCLLQVAVFVINFVVLF